MGRRSHLLAGYGAGALLQSLACGGLTSSGSDISKPCPNDKVLLRGACVTCTERNEAAVAAMRQLLTNPEWLVCDEDADCIIISDFPSCLGGCHTVIAQVSRQDFLAAAASLDREFCDPAYVCVWVTAGCPEPGRPMCERGVCALPSSSAYARVGSGRSSSPKNGRSGWPCRDSGPGGARRCWWSSPLR